jgi:two-component system chemotaxis sensor kinase CheA
VLDDAGAAAPGRSAVVLLVEDSPTTRALQKIMLERAGHEVRVVGNGAEAWDLVQTADFDVVITDIRLPGMDGLELTARIRADERLRDLPVVLVTSTNERDERERAARGGHDRLHRERHRGAGAVGGDRRAAPLSGSPGRGHVRPRSGNGRAS